MTGQEQREYLQRKIENYRDLSNKIKQKNIDELTDTDFGYLVAEGGKLCQDILGCLVKDRGYQVDFKRGVVINSFKVNTDKSTENDTIDLFDFCIFVNGILPKECISFIKLIKEYRSKSINAGNNDIHKLINDFSRAMNNFLGWFDNQTDGKYEISGMLVAMGMIMPIFPLAAVAGVTAAAFGLNPFKGLTKALDFVLGDDEDDEKETLHAPKNDTRINTRQHKRSVDTLEVNVDEITNKTTNKQFSRTDSDTDSNTKLTQEEIKKHKDVVILQAIMDSVNEVKKDVKNVKEIAIENNKYLKIITQEIKSYQQLVERQLQKAITEDEIEHLMSAFADQCAERVINYMNFEDDTYKREEENLIQLLGVGAWQKMEDISRTHLTSARVAYKRLQDLQEVIDYSGVCLSVCKALEVELFKRFYKDFKSNLERKYGKDYTKYHTALLFEKDRLLNEECFSLGTAQHILGQTKEKRPKFKNGGLSDVNNKKVLHEYVKECLLSKCTDEEIETKLKDYAIKINTIRENYRNPSAHKDKVQKVQAKTCFDFVIDVEKFLKKMLDSFDR